MYISVQISGSTLIWSLNRPDRRHALGPTIGAELLQLLTELKTRCNLWLEQEAAGEPPYRCLVIRASPVRRAEGAPVWIAGGDLKELSELQNPAEGRAYAAEWARIAVNLQLLPIPVIAVIQGQAIGGGVELALAADLRIATHESEFHFKQLEVGLATGYGSSQRLVNLVGLARATDLLLRCRRLSAQEALALGLINDLAHDDAALEILLASLCEDLSKLSAKGLMVQKRMLQAPHMTQQSHLIERELDLFESLWMSPSHRYFLKKFIVNAKV